MSLFKWLSLVIYVALLAYVVFFHPMRTGKPWNERHVYLIPFKNTIDSFSHLEHHSIERRIFFFISNFFGNIIMFVPVAFFLIDVFHINKTSSVFFIGTMASVAIECLQYLFRVGVWDIDDVILNSVGVLVGILIWKRFLPLLLRKFSYRDDRI